MHCVPLLILTNTRDAKTHSYMKNPILYTAGIHLLYSFTYGIAYPSRSIVAKIASSILALANSCCTTSQNRLMLNQLFITKSSVYFAAKACFTLSVLARTALKSNSMSSGVSLSAAVRLQTTAQPIADGCV